MSEPAPVDALRDLTRVTAVATAPDGDRVAFLAAREPDVERRVGRSREDDGRSGADGGNRGGPETTADGGSG
jgi:hypothetical protein